MNGNELKKLAASAVLLPALALLMLHGATRTRAAQDFDAAAAFKAKCAMCHGQTAEKKFDATKADEQLVDSVLKGVKTEKPPAMPSFEAKGVTPEQARALVAHMKSLRQ